MVLQRPPFVEAASVQAADSGGTELGAALSLALAAHVEIIPPPAHGAQWRYTFSSQRGWHASEDLSENSNIFHALRKLGFNVQSDKDNRPFLMLSELSDFLKYKVTIRRVRTHVEEIGSLAQHLAAIVSRDHSDKKNPYDETMIIQPCDSVSAHAIAVVAKALDAHKSGTLNLESNQYEITNTDDFIKMLQFFQDNGIANPILDR